MSATSPNTIAAQHSEPRMLIAAPAI
jgi:hypothetical protein